MKSNEYWRQRFESLQALQMKKGDKYLVNLDKQYRKSINTMESQIAKWYSRIADNNEITMVQAKKLLKTNELEEFKWTLEEYIEHGKQNAINGQWIKELENASAKAHISRLEAIKIQLRDTVENLYSGQHSEIKVLLKDMYESGYYKTAYEIQKGLNSGSAMSGLDINRIEKVLSKPWTPDGMNFSDRIWKSKTDLINTLYTELTQDIILGRSPDKTIGRIAQKMNTSKLKAGRLVMTESAFFASASQKDCYSDLGVEQYEICSTLDLKTSEICRELDGKIFKMSEYTIGVTAPPFHCWCRTCTVPYFEDNYGERISRDESRRQFYVSSDMNYEEWKRAHVYDDVKSKELNKLQKIKPPNKTRHVLTSLSKNSKPKDSNTIIMPDIDYMLDIECIKKGLYNKVNGNYVINNRIYSYHDNIFYPVSGEGFVTLTRAEYSWLVKFKLEKDNTKLKYFLNAMGATDSDIDKVTEILRKGGIL